MTTMKWVSIADLKIGFDLAVAGLNLFECYKPNRALTLWLKGMNNRHHRKPRWYNLFYYKIALNKFFTNTLMESDASGSVDPFS